MLHSYSHPEFLMSGTHLLDFTLLVNSHWPAVQRQAGQNPNYRFFTESRVSTECSSFWNAECKGSSPTMESWLLEGSFNILITNQSNTYRHTECVFFCNAPSPSAPTSPNMVLFKKLFRLFIYNSSLLRFPKCLLQKKPSISANKFFKNFKFFNPVLHVISVGCSHAGLLSSSRAMLSHPRLSHPRYRAVYNTVYIHY